MYIQPTILNTRFFHLLFVPRPQPCFPPPRELLHEFPLTSNSQIRTLFLVLILLKYSVVPSAAHSHCLLRPGGHSILFWASWKLPDGSLCPLCWLLLSSLFPWHSLELYLCSSFHYTLTMVSMTMSTQAILKSLPSFVLGRDSLLQEIESWFTFA